jgi:translation elongation factor EF-Ts
MHVFGFWRSVHTPGLLVLGHPGKHVESAYAGSIDLGKLRKIAMHVAAREPRVLQQSDYR